MTEQEEARPARLVEFKFDECSQISAEVLSWNGYELEECVLVHPKTGEKITIQIPCTKKPRSEREYPES